MSLQLFGSRPTSQRGKHVHDFGLNILLAKNKFNKPPLSELQFFLHDGFLEYSLSVKNLL